MLEQLPSEGQAAQAYLAGVVGDLPSRIARLRILWALDDDFGGSECLIPGGEVAYRAYAEARDTFVSGNFLSTVLLSQSLIENLLGGHLVIDEISREIHGRPARATKLLNPRPSMKDLLEHSTVAGVLSEHDVKNIGRLMELRNPLTHYRETNDPQNLTRRAMNCRVHPEQIMFEDARFAIETVIAILGKSEFAIGRRKPNSS